MNEEAAFWQALAESPWDDVRLVFADWLEERGDQRAPWVRDIDLVRWMGPNVESPLPALIEALGDANKRERATRALGKVGPSAVPALVKVLQNDKENAEVLLAAISALGELGPTAAPAAPHLLAAWHLARKEKDYDLRGAFCYSLFHAVCDIGSAPVEAVPLLMEKLSERGPGADNAAESAVAALVRMGPPAAQAILSVGAQLDSEDRHNAVWALAALGPDVLPIVFEALQNQEASASVRGIAVQVLGHHELTNRLGPWTEEVVMHLIRALRDKDVDMRCYAVAALGALAPKAPELVPHLLHALKDPEPTVRTGAAFALSQSASLDVASALAPLRAALRDSDAEVRYYSAFALHQLGRAAVEAVPDLLKALGDRNIIVRQGAASALAAVGGNTAEVEAGLQARLTDKSEEVRREAAAALKKIRKNKGKR
jgi:uncharacterized protein (TIGR02996 family)